MTGQHLVYLSIGTNIDREHYVTRALDELAVGYGAMDISPVYESASFGFEGDPFYNLVTGLETPEPLGTLTARLKQIESDNDRTRSGEKFSSRTLDIDILTYNRLNGVYEQIQLPRPEILEQAYVLAPFADIAPNLILPGTKATLATLWHDFDKSRQPLSKVPFIWQDNVLPVFQLSREA